METLDRLTAIEADDITSDARIARLEARLANLEQTVSCLVLALTSNLPITRQDGSRITFRAEPAPLEEPAP